MKIASDTLEVRLAIEKIKRHGGNFLTNFFWDIPKINSLVNAGLLSYTVVGRSLFLIKKNSNCVNLYYCSSSLDCLADDLEYLNINFKNTLFVLDLVGFVEPVSNMAAAFIDVGFYKYASLVRMSKYEKPSIIEQNLDCIVYADIQQSNGVFILLNQYFDQYAEQIPNSNELKDLALKKNILLYCDSNRIKGFLIYEIKGHTSLLRYWFVLPEYRGSKVGSLLFHRYLYECCQTKRQLFWVIDTNENAIVRYEHYGFKKETLVDQILTNRDIKYEKKST